MLLQHQVSFLIKLLTIGRATNDFPLLFPIPSGPSTPGSADSRSYRGDHPACCGTDSSLQGFPRHHYRQQGAASTDSPRVSQWDSDLDHSWSDLPVNDRVWSLLLRLDPILRRWSEGCLPHQPYRWQRCGRVPAT